MLEALNDITSEVKNLNSVVVNSVSHNVEFLGADMKFAAISLSLQALHFLAFGVNAQQ